MYMHCYLNNICTRINKFHYENYEKWLTNVIFIQKTAHAVNKTVIHVTNKKNSIVTLYNLHGLTPELEETSKYQSARYWISTPLLN